MARGTRIIYSGVRNKGFGSKFQNSEVDRSVQRPKRREYENKDEDNRPNNINSSYLEKRLFVFVYGAKDSLVDFLHIDNLVSAHILAAKGLTAEKNFIASGQAYFISDGKPINNFEFFRPLIEGLGYSFPTLRLPVWLIFYFAALTELIHNLVANIYNFQPFLTCTEVSKTGVTHYFSIMKAEEQLGYTPTKQNDLSEAVKILKESGCLKATKDHKPFTWNSFLVNIILGLIFAAIILSFLPLAA